MQLSHAILCDEDAWVCISCVRSDIVKTLGGGIAQIFGAVLRHLFAPDGHNLHNAGVRIAFSDGSCSRVRASLRMILQDGGAHKQVFMVKGESGLKQCILCRNLYSKDSGVVGEDGESILTCSHIRACELDFATDDDVMGTVRRLAEIARTKPAKELKLREMAAGFNHNRFNLLLDADLGGTVVKPISNFAHDWMHTLCVHGVMNTISYLLLFTLQGSGVKNAAADIAEFIMDGWALPCRHGAKRGCESLADILSASRWKSSCKGKYLKCQASELMALYPIVAWYVHAVYMRAGVCVLECTAFMLCCEVLDMLTQVARGTVSPGDLSGAVDRFLSACDAAGWRDFMHPEFHWLIHLHIELGRFGTLYTCWVHERKHKMVKRPAGSQASLYHNFGTCIAICIYLC